MWLQCITAKHQQPLLSFETSLSRGNETPASGAAPQPDIGDDMTSDQPAPVSQELKTDGANERNSHNAC
ncbi:hypothetical protein Aduo_002239 [Ancylostoma duodenale]